MNDAAHPAFPIHVVAAVVQDGQRYLLCQRAAEKRHGGLWEFPGGKVLDSETFEAATRRELTEELGVRTIAVHGEIGCLQDEGSPYLIHFLQVELEGVPFPHEHQQVDWFSLADLRDLPLAPADEAFVSLLTSRGSPASERQGPESDEQ